MNNFKIHDMFLVVLTLCLTFLLVLVAFWIMPNKKMKAVSKELKSLLQVLPISQIIKSLKDRKKENVT
jgi:hypothetical protein